MSGLGVEDVDDLRDWWDGEREGDSAGSMLGRLDGVVAVIAARHVAAALDDLDSRCCRAEFNLSDLASAHPLIADRLEGKRQGVALVRDYIRAAIPTDPASPASPLAR